MPAQQITNPQGAYGYTAAGPSTQDEFKVSSAITGPRKVVAIGTDGVSVATAATNGVASLAIGVAVESAATTDTARVVTRGYVDAVPVDGTVAAGDTLKRSVTTAGSLAATATPGTGEIFGIALAASASNTAPVWVLK